MHLITNMRYLLHACKYTLHIHAYIMYPLYLNFFDYRNVHFIKFKNLP